MGNQAQQSQYSNFAYRILSVDADSPASHAGLQPYLDFILYNPEANDQTLLSEFLQNSLETPLTLTIYNFINQQTRTVTLTPKLTKHDAILSARSLIGTEVRFERFDDLHERVYLVDGVQLESPAYRGGLGCGRMNMDATVSVDSKHTDYVIASSGSQGKTRFESSDEISQVIMEGLGKEVVLVVYNTVMQGVREVCIVPRRNWGGSGILGCQFIEGTRIPRMQEEVQGETSEERVQVSDKGQRVYMNDETGERQVIQIEETKTVNQEEQQSPQQDKETISNQTEELVLSPQKTNEVQQPSKDWTKKEDVRTHHIENGRPVSEHQAKYLIETEDTLVFHTSDKENNQFFLFQA